MEKIKVGLIGFGLSGKSIHTPLVQAHGGYEIKKVFSSRRDEIAQVLPAAEAVSSVEAILADPEIELVINTGPNEYHFQHSAAALQAGKHVVVEKPFVNTSEEGEKLISMASKADRRLAVFHNRRWDADFLTIQKLIASGELGEIKQFESHFDRFRPNTRSERWREQSLKGSGIFYDLGSHLIDQALVLFGLPDDVIADIGCQKEQGSVDDYFHVILKYNKMRVILHGSSFTNSTPRFQINATKGSFVKYGLDPQENELKGGKSPGAEDFGREPVEAFGTLTQCIDDKKIGEKIQSVAGNYTFFYQQLYKHIKVIQHPSPVTPQSALDVIRIIETAYKSSNDVWLAT